jgi:hypothetical protein
MDIKTLKEREKELISAHEKISAEIESLMDQRIKMVGAINENKYIQKQLENEN